MLRKTSELKTEKSEKNEKKEKYERNEETEKTEKSEMSVVSVKSEKWERTLFDLANFIVTPDHFNSTNLSRETDWPRQSH